MFDRISLDLKEAMKAQDKHKLSVLRMLKSKLIENKTSAHPIAEPDVVIQYAKQLKDALITYPAGSDAQQQLEAELATLAAYLPAQLNEADVVGLIRGIVEKTQAKQMGVVMKELSPLIKGKFDGKRATELIQQALGS